MMERDAVLSLLSATAKAYQMTGSRYICTPPPLDTDEDYVALVEGNEWVRALESAGFILNTDSEMYDECPDFYAFRQGEFNIICVESSEMYGRWVEATETAKSQNLTDKAARIALFQKILYGVEPVMLPL